MSVFEQYNCTCSVIPNALTAYKKLKTYTKSRKSFQKCVKSFRKQQKATRCIRVASLFTMYILDFVKYNKR